LLVIRNDFRFDYLVEVQGQIMAAEIKSGSTGKMQSLHRFLAEKNAPWGLRLSLENFSAYDQIRVLPLYAVSNIGLAQYPE
jgi:uncharacterized protein